MALLFSDSNKKPIKSFPTPNGGAHDGISGRDPIFHAQLESEKALYPSQEEFSTTLAIGCHGVAWAETVRDGQAPPFNHQIRYALPNERDGKYGALARDVFPVRYVIRCRKRVWARSVATGKFKLDEPNVINGPYESSRDLR